MPLAEHQPRIVILSAAGAIGGIERNVVNLTRMFTQRGYHTRCVFPLSPKSNSLLEWCRQQGVEVEASAALLGQADTHTLAATRRLRDMLSTWQPTAVSLHYPDILSLKDILAVRLAGVKHCIVTIHAVPVWSFKRRMMTRLAARMVDFVVVHSGPAGQAVIAGGVPARKVAYFPPGLHLPKYVPTRAVARARLGLPDEAFIIGTHARLTPEKGIDRLIEAVGQLPPEMDGPTLLIAGDGDLREGLTALGTAKLGSRMRLLGHLDGNDLADFYASLDVFALTPVCQEAFGLVYIEAALFGVPSVGWRVGGVPEAVIDGKTGLLVAPYDVAELVEAIARLRSDPILRAKLGTGAQARAHDDFTEARMADGYAKALHLMGTHTKDAELSS